MENQKEFILPTPDLSHLTSNDYKIIYEPSEDTFLFLDALNKERDYILNELQPKICLEIGVGSGCVSVFLGKLLLSGKHKIQDFTLFGTDINLDATRVALETAKRNNIIMEVVATDLFSGLESRLKNKVDILLFNPPYVPSSDDDFEKSLEGNIDAAWAGGEFGTRVLERLIPLIKEILSEKGNFYLVVLQQNKPAQIIAKMKTEGFSSEVVMKRRTLSELLYILKFKRK